MSHYLVTGGAGFIGSHLVEELIRRGEQVRVLDNLSSGKRRKLAHIPGVEFLEGDIVDPAACARATEGVDYVLHQAAIPSVPRSVKDPVTSNRSNIDGTLNILVAARDAGVKRLSEINMMLALLLLVFVLAVGPTMAVLGGLVNSLGAYLQYLPALSNPINREDANFVQGWTAFYWAWWISWSPFVGMFIARVSRGRTVREFLVSVLIVPSLACVVWMAVFGGTAITQVISDGYQSAVNADLPLQLFMVLDALPLAQISSFIGSSCFPDDITLRNRRRSPSAELDNSTHHIHLILRQVVATKQVTHAWHKFFRVSRI